MLNSVSASNARRSDSPGVLVGGALGKASRDISAELFHVSDDDIGVGESVRRVKAR